MAGIWQPWTDKQTGEMLDTFAVVTTDADELMTQVHNTKKRMPTILTDETAKLWLSEDLSEKEIREPATFHTPTCRKPTPSEKILEMLLTPKNHMNMQNYHHSRWRKKP